MTPPVLLIAFRRPELVLQVLDALREVAPSRLYVAVDGPRHQHREDAHLVQRVWDVVEAAVDWPCDVAQRARTVNLGCRYGVIDAIDWFFSMEEEGIILEDDIVPTPEFFDYCSLLLDRYRDDERVMGISGDNCGEVKLSGPWSYGFVRHPDIWGWATWRRAWMHYDRDMEMWKSTRSTPLVDSVFTEVAEKRHFTQLFDRISDDGVPDTWDYQWAATTYLRGGLTTIPARSLVQNIGFGQDATHTKTTSHLSNIKTGSVMPMVHPPLVHVDRCAELQILERVEGLDVSSRALGCRPGWARRLRQALIGDHR
jgi:hypothetical protein